MGKRADDSIVSKVCSKRQPLLNQQPVTNSPPFNFPVSLRTNSRYTPSFPCITPAHNRHDGIQYPKISASWPSRCSSPQRGIGHLGVVVHVHLLEDRTFESRSAHTCSGESNIGVSSCTFVRWKIEHSGVVMAIHPAVIEHLGVAVVMRVREKRLL